MRKFRLLFLGTLLVLSVHCTADVNGPSGCSGGASQHDASVDSAVADFASVDLAVADFASVDLATKFSYFPKSYGAPAGSEVGRTIFPTPDGGYIVVGTSRSFGAIGRPTIWALKLDWQGNILWQRFYQEADYEEEAFAARPILDGAGTTLLGFYIVGVSHQHPDAGNLLGDALVLKITSTGDLVWAKRYGDPNKAEWLQAVRVTSDGGCVVAGQTRSDADGSKKMWVLKLASDGSVDWQHAYGGAGDQEANDIEITHDGKFLVAGRTSIGGTGSALLLRITPAAIELQRRFGDANGHTAWTVAEVAFSSGAATSYDYVLAGEAMSTSTNYAWVIRVNDDTITWQKAYPWGSISRAQAITKSPNGNLVFAGFMGFGGVLTTRFFVQQVSFETGAVVWGKTYSSAIDAPDAIAYSVVPVAADAYAPAGFILAGNTWNSAETSGSFWVLRTKADGTLPTSGCPDGIIMDAPAPTLDTSTLGVAAGVSQIDPTVPAPQTANIIASATTGTCIAQCNP